jgi:hypothetical protein
VKFFVPGFECRLAAEHVWAEVRRWLAEMGLPTRPRRIRALACEIEGRDHFVAVGAEPPDDDEPVMVILEASNLDIFYVCTPSRGVLEDIPYPMWLDERWRVIDFDEEVVGHA